jgi:hypothetical protein
MTYSYCAESQVLLVTCWVCCAGNVSPERSQDGVPSTNIVLFPSYTVPATTHFFQLFQYQVFLSKNTRGNMVSYIREEYRLRVFENRILRRIFGPKR